MGIKAPGGTIMRTDTNGSAVELVAGGLQNPYDLAFNAGGRTVHLRLRHGMGLGHALVPARRG